MEKPPPPCFDGVRQTVNAIILLWDAMRGEGSLYLLTIRCNQDPIENSFAVIRSKGGNNNNPTARQFRRSLQHSSQINLMNPPKTSNCEPDQDIWLKEADNKLPAQGAPASTLGTPARNAGPPSPFAGRARPASPTSEEAEPMEVNDGGIFDPQATLDMCAMTYVAGWLARRCLLKHKCGRCQVDLVKEGQHLESGNQSLIYYLLPGLHDEGRD